MTSEHDCAAVCVVGSFQVLFLPWVVGTEVNISFPKIVGDPAPDRSGW